MPLEKQVCITPFLWKLNRIKSDEADCNLAVNPKFRSRKPQAIRFK